MLFSVNSSEIKGAKIDPVLPIIEQNPTPIPLKIVGNISQI
jgi:hypothetical protein